jgi:hypothetical protein
MVLKIAITVLITMLFLIAYCAGLGYRWEQSGKRRMVNTLIYIIRVALIIIFLSIPTIILSCVWEV